MTNPGQVPEKSSGTVMEARLLGRYLLGREPDAELVDRYCQAMAVRPTPIEGAAEQRLWRIALGSRLGMKLVDSGLALRAPHCALRRRILTMLGILEASPGFSELFLPRRYGALDFLRVAGTVFSMGIAGGLGCLLVSFLGYRES